MFMKIRIKTRKADKLYDREYILAEADFEDKTPSRDSVKSGLAKLVSADGSLVVIRKIAQAIGTKKAFIHAYIYKNAEIMEKIEQKYILKRNTEKKREGNAKEEDTAVSHPAPAPPVKKESGESVEANEAQEKPVEVPKNSGKKSKEEDRSQRDEKDKSDKSEEKNNK